MSESTTTSAPATPREPFVERWPDVHLQREGAADLDLLRGVRVVVADAAVISDSVDEDDALLIVRVHRAQTADDAFRDVRDEVAQWLADLLSGHTQDVEEAMRHRLTGLVSAWTAAAERIDEVGAVAHDEGADEVETAAANAAEHLRVAIADVEKVLAVGNTR
jgi:hypothetical protein